MAQVKHYADYNQETYRNTASDNVIVSERAQRRSTCGVRGGVQQGQAYSVMCSYSSVGGTYCVRERRTDPAGAGERTRFTGFVTSDWGGTHSTVASANNAMTRR